MEGELELGDDPEIAAASAKRPEEIRMLIRAGPHHRPVREHDLCAHKAVDGQPAFPRQKPGSATERQAAQAGCGVHPRGRRKSVGLRLAVKIAKQGTASDNRFSFLWIDPHRLNGREVNQQAIINHGVARDAVPAAADGERQVVFAGEVQRFDDIGNVLAESYCCRSAINHAVPDLAGLVIAGVAALDQLTVKLVDKMVERGWFRQI
ncbi:MAG TPA: hypothetical protein VMK31_06885 [Sphingomicrobium sp.]|nr:hypothetical protein [Sphingomicrobium sp.]